jgi:hypothetical protein
MPCRSERLQILQAGSCIEGPIRQKPGDIEAGDAILLLGIDNSLLANLIQPLLLAGSDNAAKLGALFHDPIQVLVSLYIQSLFIFHAMWQNGPVDP